MTCTEHARCHGFFEFLFSFIPYLLQSESFFRNYVSLGNLCGKLWKLKLDNLFRTYFRLLHIHDVFRRWLTTMNLLWKPILHPAFAFNKYVNYRKPHHSFDIFAFNFWNYLGTLISQSNPIKFRMQKGPSIFNVCTAGTVLNIRLQHLGLSTYRYTQPSNLLRVKRLF